MSAPKDMPPLIPPSHRPENNNNNSQLLFNNQRRGIVHVGDPGPKTRELTGFIEDRDQRFFQPPPHGSEYRRSMIGSVLERGDCPETQNWNGNTRARVPNASDSSDEEDNDEMDDEEEEDEGELLNVNCNTNGNTNNNGSSDSVYSNAAADKIGNVSAAGTKNHSSIGSNREMVMKDGNIVQSVNNNDTRGSLGGNQQQVRATHYQNAIADPNGDVYYPQFMQGLEDSSGQGRRDLAIENGRNDVSLVSESGNSLKRILSDSLTGALMDDAMILPCGHSFGGGGIQHVLKMKACYTCSQSILEESVQPNLSLRAAVLAFRREEELRSHRTSKRSREKFEDKGISGDSSLADASRGRGVQFPFVVSDRVVIKGNKRTPERFVGREAVVTTQCLNGWYVVKTLDNAESVKLQYRSLAKVADNPSSKPMLTKIVPNWL